MQAEDKAWCREKLEAYLAAVKRYDSFINEGTGFNQPAFEEAVKLEPSAKAIMRRVLPDLRDYELVMGPSRTTAITFSLQALTLLEEAEEIERHLGPAGPQPAADEMHPWIWEAAQSLWDTGHYREAVQAGATSLNAHIQTLVSRRDISDYKLATETFSENPPSAGRPRLRWPGDPANESTKSMQDGLRLLASGIFRGIRNSATHELTELPEQAALEQLVTMSLVARWIETCDLTVA
ncbi:TIGR02391 family protein [Amycolatopsis sp. NPDC004772]